MINSPIYKEQVLGAEECDYLVWLAESQDEWDPAPGFAYDNRRLAFFTSLQHHRYSSPALQKLSMQIYRKSQDIVSRAIGGLAVNLDFMALVRALPGDQPTPHNFDHPGAGRVGGCVIFLNDNYGGGSVNFVNTGQVIAPRAGAAYICGVKNEDLHVVDTTSGGARYAIVSTWTTNPMSEPLSTQVTKMRDYLAECCNEEQPVVKP